jgi:hypothetical protein
LAIVNLAMVNLAWIFLSSSRGNILMAGMCLVYLILGVRGVSRRLAFAVVAVVLAGAVTLQFSEFSDRAVERIGHLLDPDYNLTSRTSGRYDRAIGAWHIFLNNPFGVGTGGFRVAWARLGDLGGTLQTHGVGTETAAHSGWMRVLAENGVVGGLLFAAYVLSFAVAGFQRARLNRDLLLLGVLTSAVLAVGFVSTEFSGKGLWFLAAGVTVLLHGLDLRVPRRNKRLSPS